MVVASFPSVSESLSPCACDIETCRFSILPLVLTLSPAEGPETRSMGAFSTLFRIFANSSVASPLIDIPLRFFELLDTLLLPGSVTVISEGLGDVGVLDTR